MIVAVVLVLATFLARALGLLGVGYFETWPAAVRVGLAAMLLFASSAHFNRMQADMIRMVPGWMPRPRATVIITGVLEWVGAVGLLVPATQRLAGWALIALFIALLPANIHAARSQLTLRGRPATALRWRVPLQLIFIGLTWWSSCMH
jgi:uncharacterized membrane protein